MVIRGCWISFVLVMVASALFAQDKLEIHSAPEGERLSEDFRVWVNGRELPVYYKADRNEPAYQEDCRRFGKGGGDYSFAYFDFKGRAQVRIESGRFSGHVTVRPLSKKVTPQMLGDGVFEFTLDEPAKLSIEGANPKNGLILIARAIEEPPLPKGHPNLIYFGPGVHRPGVIHLKSGQTLYIAGGAVVKAGIVARGRGITICGRGIIDGSGFKWPTNPAGERGLINFVECDGVQILGVIVRDSPCWTIVPMHSCNVRIENVTICNSSNENDDGIDPCNTQRLRIRDCFIRTDDDCIAFKGWSQLRGRDMNIETILIEGSTFWCDRARVFLLGHESKARHMRAITVRDCDIIHFAMVPFLIEPADDMRISQIIFSDIRVHGEGQHELIRLRPV
ncbi:MAG: glycosyl hydrolase family 28 protein, partial [Luteolibacter sp.]